MALISRITRPTGDKRQPLRDAMAALADEQQRHDALLDAQTRIMHERHQSTGSGAGKKKCGPHSSGIPALRSPAK